MLLFNNDTMFPVLLFARRQATPRQHWFFNCEQWCRCDFSLRYGVCSHSYVLPGDRPHDLGYFIVPFLALSVWRWIVRSCCFPALDIIRLLANSWDRIQKLRKRPDQCSWMELWLLTQSTFLSSVRGRRWTLERREWVGWVKPRAKSLAIRTIGGQCFKSFCWRQSSSKRQFRKSWRPTATGSTRRNKIQPWC